MVPIVIGRMWSHFRKDVRTEKLCASFHISGNSTYVFEIQVCVAVLQVAPVNGLMDSGNLYVHCVINSATVLNISDDVHTSDWCVCTNFSHLHVSTY